MKENNSSPLEPTEVSQNRYHSPGTNELAWLTGDFTGDGRMQIAQPYDNQSPGDIRMCVYGWQKEEKKMHYDWHGNIGQGAATTDWVVGDINGDGKDEIITFMEDQMIVYLWTGQGIDDLKQNILLAPYSSPFSWVIGDIDGDGLAEVIQFYDSNGRMGINVYGWSATLGTMTLDYSSSDLGQGWGNNGIFVGNFDNKDRDDMLQTYGSNSSNFGLNLYKWDAHKHLIHVPFSQSNMGQGAAKTQILTANLNGDKQRELLQVWNSGSQLSLNIYQWNSTQGIMETVFSKLLGTSYATQFFLMADVNNDGQDELIQAYVDNNNLCMNVFLWDKGAAPGEGTMTNISSSPVAGQETSFASFLAGNALTKHGPAQIYQQWDNNGNLGMIIYEWSGSFTEVSMGIFWSGTFE